MVSKKADFDMNFVKMLITLLTAFGGAVGYVHTSFTKEVRTDKLEIKLEKEVKQRNANTIVIKNILCKMAIKQKLDNAADICSS